MVRFPDRTFVGLTAPLQLLEARGTAKLLVTLEARGSGQFRAVAPSGAPFNITLPLVVSGGTLVGGASTVTISAGAVESDLVEVTVAPGSSVVTVDIGELPTPAPPRNNDGGVSPFGIRYRRLGHVGYTLAKATDLPLTFRPAPPAVTLEAAQRSLRENGGTTTLTARLSDGGVATEELQFDVTVAADPPAAVGDLSVEGELTIAARATAGTVTVRGVDNDRYTGPRTVRVSAAARVEDTATVSAPVELTITDNEPAPAARLALSAEAIDEGEAATVSAVLDGAAPGAPVTFAVTAAADGRAVAFTQSGDSLTIAAGATRSAALTITTTEETTYAPHRRLRVAATVAGLPGLTAPPARTLTIREVDDPPAVELLLSPTSVAERTGGRSRVTARLGLRSATTTILEVSTRAIAPATADDFTQDGDFLTIAANQTESTGTVTITARDNDRYAGPRQVAVSATVVAGSAVPATANLHIEEDERVPPVALVLSLTEIEEQGGSAAVSAELDTAIAAEMTLSVTTEAVAPAVAGEFTQDGTTLTIAAGDTTSTGVVTVSGVADGHYIGAKPVRVSATVVVPTDVGAPGPKMLRIKEDEAVPALTVSLSPESIREDAKVATVTATLQPPYRDPLTAEVTAQPVAPATAADYELGTNRVLSFAGGNAASSGVVTITSVAGDLAAPPELIRIGAATEGPPFVRAQPVSLTITDTQPPPRFTLLVSPDSIAEEARFDRGGAAQVTATLDVATTQATTLSVTVEPEDKTAPAADFEQLSASFWVAAGATEASGVVYVIPASDKVHEPDSTYTVSGEVTSGYATAPPDVTLTITDNDDPGEVELQLGKETIEEGDGAVTVTARMRGNLSAAATTVEVKVSPPADDARTDYVLSDNRMLTIAARARESTGTVTITPDDDVAYSPARTLTVTGTASSALQVTGPAARTLKITDDDRESPITVTLSPESILEQGGSALVSASVSVAYGVPVTLTVTATAQADREHEFSLSGTTLAFAAGATQSTGEVRITAADNAYDAPNHVVTVTATPVASGVEFDVTAPASRRLTITDDEGTPAVTLRVDPARIDEAGGEATLSATIDPPSFAATTVRLSVDPVAPATASDVDLPDRNLTIAAQSAASGTVTITAVDNDVYADEKRVYVRGDADNDLGVTDPAPVELAIAESDDLPALTLLLSPDRIAEAGGTATVSAELDLAIDRELTLSVTAAAVAPARAAEFRQDGHTLTIAAGATESTGQVTVAGVADGLYFGEKQVLVGATVTGSAEIGAPAPVTVTITEDEDEPALTVALAPESIGEQGGTSAVTAALSPPFRDPVTVEVTATPVAPATVDDYVLGGTELTFAGGSAGSSTVTVTAVPDAFASPPTTIGIAAGMESPLELAAAPVSLTITDVRAQPAVSLVVSHGPRSPRRAGRPP